MRSGFIVEGNNLRMQEGAFFVNIACDDEMRAVDYASDELLLATARTAIDEEIQSVFKLNACCRCGNTDPPLGAGRVGTGRVFFCPPCYPELIADAEFVSHIQYEE